jgi:hypothetical protein
VPAVVVHLLANARRRGRARLGAAMLGLALATGCHGGETTSPPVTCATGSVAGPDGACLAVGIQGCTALFVDADGLCRPSIDKCPAGTIPSFAEGCVPVGIPGCAAGFLEADGLCHPAMSKCPAGTFAVPQEGCVPVDGPDGCGAAPWGDLADTAGTVYVDATAPAGGTGGKQSPVSTLAAALALAPPGGRVALAAGTYHEPLHLTQAVTLEGRCASLVRVDGVAPAASFDAVVWVDGAAGVTLRGLTLGGKGKGVGLEADDAPGLTLDRVHVKGADKHGILLSGAASQATLTHVWVEGTTATEPGFIFNTGLRIEAGARATITAGAFTGNENLGVQAVGHGTDLTVTDSLIEGTLAHAQYGGGGCGLDGVVGARVTVTATASRQNRSYGIQMEGQGAMLTLTDSLVEGTLPEKASQSVGRGVDLEFGAGATITGTAILANHEVGVFSDSGGTGGPVPTLILTRNLIAGTLPSADHFSGGRGIDLQSGVTATLTGNAVVHNRELGVFLEGALYGSVVTMTGNLVEGTTADPADPTSGRGVGVAGGAQVTLRGNALVGNQDAALDVYGGLGPATVTAMNDLLAGTLPRADGQDGFAVSAAKGVTLDLSGCLVEDNRAAALLVEASTVSLTRCLVTGVREGSFTLSGPTGLVEHAGDGVVATQSAQVDVTTSRVEGCARAGLLFDDSTGTLRGTASTLNQFGLVLQGQQQPSYAAGQNRISGNTKRDIVTDTELPIPTAPSPIPPL